MLKSIDFGVKWERVTFRVGRGCTPYLLVCLIDSELDVYLPPPPVPADGALHVDLRRVGRGDCRLTIVDCRLGWWFTWVRSGWLHPKFDSETDHATSVNG